MGYKKEVIFLRLFKVEPDATHFHVNAPVGRLFTRQGQGFTIKDIKSLRLMDLDTATCLCDRCREEVRKFNKRYSV